MRRWTAVVGEYVEKYHSIPVLADKLMECIEQVMNDGSGIKD